MHQLVNNYFFKILLFRIYYILKQNRFSVVTVNFEIACL